MKILHNLCRRRLNDRRRCVAAFMILGVGLPLATQAQSYTPNSQSYLFDNESGSSTDGAYTVTWEVRNTSGTESVEIVSGDLLTRTNCTGAWTSIANVPGHTLWGGSGQTYQYHKNESVTDNGIHNYWMSATIYTGYTYYNTSDYDDVTVEIPGPPTADSYPDETYVVLKGDANGDCRLDFLVTKPSGSSGVVADYFLIQQQDKSFTVVHSIGSEMDYKARRWPVSNLTVYRDDLSFDGYMDFRISNVRAEVEDSHDMIVYTERGIGLEVVQAIMLDNKFERAYQEVILSLWEPEAFLDSYTGYTCQGEEFDAGPVFVTCTLSLSFSGIFDTVNDIGFDFCSVSLALSAGPQPTCFAKSDQFLPELWDYYYSSDFGQFIRDGAGHCDSCIEDYKNQYLNSSFVPVAGAASGTSMATTAARVARVAFILAGIMVADDVTVVGVWNDALIPVALLIGGYAMEIALSEHSVAEQTDAFARTGECRPQDPQHISGIGNIVNTGSSRKLKNNLLNAGCSCPAGLSQGHHIVEKKGGDFIGEFWGSQSRQLLEGCGIDIDDAVNGVCLPSSREIKEQTGTNAVIHQGDGIHSKDYNRVLFDQLSDAHSQDGCDGVVNKLKDVGDGLSEGVKFW